MQFDILEKRFHRQNYKKSTNFQKKMDLMNFIRQNIEDGRIFQFVLVLALASTLCEARTNYCDLCDQHIACGNNGVSWINSKFIENRLNSKFLLSHKIRWFSACRKISSWLFVFVIFSDFVFRLDWFNVIFLQFLRISAQNVLQTGHYWKWQRLKKSTYWNCTIACGTKSP